MSYWPEASLAHMCADTWVRWLGVDFLPVVSSLFHVCVCLPEDCGVDSSVELRLNSIFLLDVWNPLPAALYSSTENSAPKQNKDGYWGGVHSHAQHFYQPQWKSTEKNRDCVMDQYCNSQKVTVNMHTVIIWNNNCDVWDIWKNFQWTLSHS